MRRDEARVTGAPEEDLGRPRRRFSVDEDTGADMRAGRRTGKEIPRALPEAFTRNGWRA